MKQNNVLKLTYQELTNKISNQDEFLEGLPTPNKAAFEIHSLYDLTKRSHLFNNLSEGTCYAIYPDGKKFVMDIESYYYNYESNWREVYQWDGLQSEIKVSKDSETPDNFTGVAIFPSGTKKYFKDGRLHRDNGPAIEWSTGAESWYLNGARHRSDGPAFKNGKDTQRGWYLKDSKVAPQEVFDQLSEDKRESAIFELNKWQEDFKGEQDV